MPLRTARQARDGGALAVRAERAGDCARAGLLAEHGDGDPRALAGGERAGAGEWRLVRAAPAGAALLPVGAQRRAGAGDPGGAGEDELGSDAVVLADRSASLDLLEGAPPPRRLAPAT